MVDLFYANIFFLERIHDDSVLGCSGQINSTVQHSFDAGDCQLVISYGYVQAIFSKKVLIFRDIDEGRRFKRRDPDSDRLRSGIGRLEILEDPSARYYCQHSKDKSNRGNKSLCGFMLYRCWFHSFPFN